MGLAIRRPAEAGTQSGRAGVAGGDPTRSLWSAVEGSGPKLSRRGEAPVSVSWAKAPAAANAASRNEELRQASRLLRRPERSRTRGACTHCISLIVLAGIGCRRPCAHPAEGPGIHVTQARRADEARSAVFREGAGRFRQTPSAAPPAILRCKPSARTDSRQG
jgi:hypothetical protein